MSLSLRAAFLFALTCAAGACASTTSASGGPSTSTTSASVTKPARWQPFDDRATATDVFDRVASAGPDAHTPAPPPALAAALDDARARWDAYLAAQGGTLTYALDIAGQDTPGQPLGPELTTPRDVSLPRWAGKRLTVVYAHRLLRASEVVTPGYVGCNKYDHLVPRDPPSPPTPCAPRQMPPMITRRSYAADLALVVEYDATGALIRERPFAAHPVPGPAPAAVPGVPGF